MVFGISLGLAACGSASTGDTGDSGGSTSGGDGGAAGLPTGSGGGNGSDPAPFTSVTQLWIGAPDDLATTVVYVFSKPTACSVLSSHGWDAQLAPGTQHLEMKEFGNGSGTYTVVTTKTPAPGEAAVNFSSNASGTPVETSGSGGTVTLTAVNGNKSTAGRYSLTFGTTQIDGTFDANYCAAGVEP